MAIWKWLAGTADSLVRFGIVPGKARSRWVSAGLADDSVLHRPKRGGSAGRDADLVVDVLDVVIGGLRRDEEPIGNRLRRQAPRRKAQHVDFATREAARMSRSLERGGFRLAVTGGDEHGAGRALLENAV